MAARCAQCRWDLSGANGNRYRHSDPSLRPDPDAALSEMVVIGHSQGGLLAKAMAVDTGDRLWDAIAYKPGWHDDCLACRGGNTGSPLSARIDARYPMLRARLPALAATLLLTIATALPSSGQTLRIAMTASDTPTSTGV